MSLYFTVPSKPLNLTVLAVTEESMNLSWSEPERANGAIEGYRIYYMFANYTDVQNLRLSNSQHIHYILKNLSEYFSLSTPFTFLHHLTRFNNLCINKIHTVSQDIWLSRPIFPETKANQFICQSKGRQNTVTIILHYIYPTVIWPTCHYHYFYYNILLSFLFPVF